MLYLYTYISIFYRYTSLICSANGYIVSFRQENIIYADWFSLLSFTNNLMYSILTWSFHPFLLLPFDLSGFCVPIMPKSVGSMPNIDTYIHIQSKTGLNNVKNINSLIRLLFVSCMGLQQPNGKKTALGVQSNQIIKMEK